ncbi:sugar hydrolase [Deltaproteobacteria bacterium]|nr:sugar hydrolase [Deltaproteobacteria bacterium]
MRLILAPLPLLLACDPAEPVAGFDPVDAVNPFIATGGPGFRVGSATPAATAPFGLVKLGPDTSNGGLGLGALHCSGYWYPDTHIEGFSHTHMHGVGVPALGDILFMPGEALPDSVRGPEDWRQAFSHDDESASPGTYAVRLADDIEVTLSATEHAGHHRYVFPESMTDPTLAIDLGYTAYGTNLGARIDVDVEQGVIYGHMTNDDSFGGSFPLYFYAVVDTGIESASTWSEGEVIEGAPVTSTGTEVGAVLHLSGHEARIRVGVSLIGFEAAQANLEAELPHDQPIDDTVAETRAVWADALQGWAVDGADDDHAAIFWTSLYHLLQMPTLYGDTDGRYVGFDGAVHQAEGWSYHSDLSLWDTYRTVHPAFDLFYPDDAADFAQSLVAMAEQGGAFPKWPVARTDGGSMIGAPADIALADAIVKEVPGWDIESAWPRLVSQARGEGTIPYNGRPAIPELESLGFIPADLVGGSVAWQLELSWADEALAMAAQTVGDDASAAHFAWRARLYTNLYDDEIGWFHARYSDGTFKEDLDPVGWEDEYVEGNAWQYLWLAPWDSEGLAATLSGEDVARGRLTEFFELAVAEGVLLGPGAYYWHGNEPDIHAPWLFSLWGDRPAAAKWVDWVRETQYHNDPDGLAGNDDAGTLSAWYLFAAAGFYPIAGTRTYILAEPEFDRLEFPVAGGTFEVRKEGEGTTLDRTELNGITWTKPTFDHGELEPGGALVFVYR